MNIAILSYEYPPDTGFGGIGTYTYYHARALAKLGHRVHVFAGATTVGAFESEHDGVRVTRLKIEGWLHALLTPARRRRCFWFNNRVETAYAQHVALRRTLDRERFDIVEAPECGADASMVSLLSSIPVAVRFHSPARLIMDTYDTPPLDRRLTPIVERIAMSRARVRTACSQYVAKEVAAKIGVPGPIHVIPNGIDLEMFDAGDPGAGGRFGLPAGGLTVVFANRLERRKGIHVVAEVAEQILPRYRHVRFVLAGRDLFGYVAGTVLPRIYALGVEDRFHVLGGLGLADVRALLKRADIFMLPSLWENCPYSAIEAMAAGRAIVSSDCGGMPELIADGDNGLLARTGDADAFVACLEELIESRERRERLGAAARGTVEARLTDVDVARRTVELYDATLSG